jgi:hypothetical protein
MLKFVVASLAVLLVAGIGKASASPLNPETSSVEITYNKATNSSASGTTFVSLDGATASVDLYPIASVQASIGAGYTQSVMADLDYYFALVGGSPGDLVPVLIATKLLTSAAYPQYGSAVFSVWSGSVNLASINVCTYSTDCSADSFDGTVKLQAASGSQYRIHMAATAEGIAASASVDPYIFVDPAFPSAASYRIDVSDGVGNTPATTPLPPSMTLFASGLGLLGLLYWRKIKAARHSTL